MYGLQYWWLRKTEEDRDYTFLREGITKNIWPYIRSRYASLVEKIQLRTDGYIQNTKYCK